MADMLHSKGKLFTAALNKDYKKISTDYDVPFISQHLDFLNIMTYDYHGFWNGHHYTGHNAPLFR